MFKVKIIIRVVVVSYSHSIRRQSFIRRRHLIIMRISSPQLSIISFWVREGAKRTQQEQHPHKLDQPVQTRLKSQLLQNVRLCHQNADAGRCHNEFPLELVLRKHTPRHSVHQLHDYPKSVQNDKALHPDSAGPGHRIPHKVDNDTCGQCDTNEQPNCFEN